MVEMLSQRTLKRIEKTGAQRILLQVPEGLKTRVLEAVKALENEGYNVFLSIEPCFGACDLRDHEAHLLKCDLLLHIGHSEILPETEVPVIYEECIEDYDPVPLLKQFLEDLKPYHTIGLLTTLQFLPSLKKAKSFLKSKNKEILMEKPKKAKHPGQVLGCDYSAALPLEDEIDCFLFIGSGLFHPLGLAKKTDKPVLFLDVEKEELSNLKQFQKEWKVKKELKIEKARDRETFGILISTKRGQLNLKTAEEVKKTLKKKGKKTFLLTFDTLTPDKILGLQIDCLVNCACPRLTEDYKQFKKPVLDPEDTEKL